MVKLLRGVALLLACLPFPAAASAQETLWPRGAFSLGGFFSTSDFEARIDASSTRTGTEIDFERDLGVSGDQDVLTAQLGFRTGRRHEWTLGYYEIEATGRRTIERQVTIGEQVFPAGAELSSQYQITQIEGAYTYWAAQRPRFGFGLSLGAVALMLDAEAAARLSVGGVTLERRGDASTTAPVPMLGAELRGLIGDRLVASAVGRFLPEVDIEDVTGQAMSASLGLEWRIVEAFGVGVSYDLFDIEADLDQPDWRGNVNVTIEGFRLIGRYVW